MRENISDDERRNFYKIHFINETFHKFVMCIMKLLCSKSMNNFVTERESKVMLDKLLGI